MGFVIDQIQRTIIEKNLTPSDVAIANGLSNSFMSRLLSQKTKEHNFGNVILIINWLFPNLDTRKELIFDYYKKITKPENIRAAYEWLWMNWERDELRSLISMRKKSRDYRDLEFNEIYSLLLERSEIKSENELERKRELSRLLNKAGMIKEKSKQESVKCLCTIFQMNVYGDLNEYDMVEKLYDTIDVNKLGKKEKYLKYSFKVRLNELLSQRYWKQNNLNEARKVTIELIQNVENKYMLASAYHRLGMTYCFVNRETSVNYVKKSIEIFRSINRNMIADLIEKKNIPFIYSVWGETYTQTDDKMELAHNYISCGNPQIGLELIKDFDNNDPFICFYKGKATKNVNLLKKSYEIFTKEWHDHFYAQLPLKELEVLKEAIPC